jgi:hypothetical protein
MEASSNSRSSDSTAENTEPESAATKPSDTTSTESQKNGIGKGIGDQLSLNLKENLDRDFILIRRGTSFDTYNNLNDPHSLESKLARSRGAGHLPFADQFNTDDELSRPTEDSDTIVRVEPGKINTKTGYMMMFVDPEYHDLHLYDIMSLLSLKSWPVPESALNSLPESIQGTLFTKDRVKIQGQYDSENQRFVDVKPGWKVEPENRLDLLMKTIEKLDGRLAPAISLVIHEHGSDRWSNPNSIAEAREIEADTVRAQIEEAEEQLSEYVAHGDL